MKRGIRWVTYMLVFCFALSNVSWAQLFRFDPDRDRIISGSDRILSGSDPIPFVPVDPMVVTNIVPYVPPPLPPVPTTNSPSTEADDGGGGGSSGGTVIAVAVGVVVVAAVVGWFVWRHNKSKQKTVINMEANLPMIEHRINDSVSLTLDPALKQALMSDPLSVREWEVEDFASSEVSLRFQF